MAHCKRCNRRIDHSRDEKTGIRRRTRDHVCPTVTIQRKKKDERTGDRPTKIVHEDRVAKGGDLHGLTTGKKAPWEIVQRNIQKIEKLAEKQKKTKKKKSEKTLVAPSGEPLTAPKG